MHDFVTKLHEPTKDLMIFYGAGDHGGGPAKETIHAILDAQKQPGAPKIRLQHSRRATLTTCKHAGQPKADKVDPSLPVVDDDLQHHSVGCYTAVSEIKKDNRTTEAALVTGEKMAALANVAGGIPLPQERFRRRLEKSAVDAVPR